ncbi:MAG: IPT/TIG domain-containing protein, partial [Bryobacteraceae bacterium]
MMKYFALLLVPAGLCIAAEFRTGQAARLVLGQETFTQQSPESSQTVLGAVSGLAYANDTLFVVDANRVQAGPQNHRVVIFRDLSAQVPGPTEEPMENDRCPLCTGFADIVVGQPDFSKNEIALSSAGMRTPTAVATDGTVLAVADTDNNRILIWNSIPASNGRPADVVVGQPDFESGTLNFGGAGSVPSATGLRGPQGVWIQAGKLYVADTQNHRVLIWNSIPTSNGQPADVVLGQPDFTTFVQSDLTQIEVDPKPNNMLNPVSVTSDGTRLYVTDLGHNRVLVWNSIPTSNQAPADFVLGQPDVAGHAKANNVEALCEPTGQDEAGENVFPARCAATMNFPRFALSDGQRLFVADGGNDRVLVWNTIPNRSGQPADVVLGQITDTLVLDSEALRIAAADSLRTPMALAWDGENLYVSDPFNRRVLAFTPGDVPLPLTGVRNAASQDIFAVGSVVLSGTVKVDDEITIKIQDREYKYKLVANDDFGDVINGVVAKINDGAGDPAVYAAPNVTFNAIILTSRLSGPEGDTIDYSATANTGAEITLTTGGARLSGGEDAGKIAPGSLVTILGENLAAEAMSAPDEDRLPTTLGGVEVYFDGIKAPLLYVSPDQINAQMPYDVNDASSVSAYVRMLDGDGNARITTAIAVPIIPRNPGIFADGGTDPRPAVALHGSSSATGAISVDGTIKENDVATVTIEDRQYTYTVKAGDTLASVRDALIALINEDEKVSARAAGAFTRIRLEARETGPAGEGITYAASSNEGGSLLVTPLTPALC